MVRAVRPPNAWADAQRAFHGRYLADPDALPHLHVHVRWWVNDRPAGVVIALAGIVGRWLRGRGFSEGTHIAVYSATARSPARPVIVFPVADGMFDRPAGSCDAVIVGEVGRNGVCCLELPDATVIWPTYNPMVPTGRTVPAP